MRARSGLLWPFLRSLAVPSLTWLLATSAFAYDGIQVNARPADGAGFAVPVRLELLRDDVPAFEAYLDAHGQCRLPPLKSGSYALRISANGYHTVVRALLPGVAQVEIELAPTSAVPGSRSTVPSAWLLAPAKVQHLVEKARRLRAAGDLDEALRALKRALEIRPGFAYSLDELGLCYAALRRPEQALEAFDQAIRAEPALLEPYLHKADLLRELKRYTDAGAVLMSAALVEPLRAEPYYLMALVHFDLGDLHRAEEACHLALQRDTTRVPEVHLLLFNIYHRRRDTLRARQQLQAYLGRVSDGKHSAQARHTLQQMPQPEVAGTVRRP